ncbi:LEF-11 [Chrysodeixis includens nucleopolyhedrovirus]|uniref:Late expression factor 11 n=1 Tax=Chrysodeixis includens nucleopolyhedrovirus TaxID=1207438 RepID=A0A5B8YUR7_9ABAC|nr:LEF-11 [Chrysodeixis includens nucleopolyhedrovirus]QED40554.1 LEF-11 [Chrysodeixis includens nucleopolyhedrovirus]
MEPRTGQYEKQPLQPQQQQQQTVFSDHAGTQEHYQCCLTRSEFYALVREVINKRKHERDVHNICEHIFSKGFSTQIEYIRNNLDKALITVGGQRRQCKRLNSHVNKINNLFTLNKSLHDEYESTIARYEFSHQKH